MTDLIARIEAAQPSEARELFEEAATVVWGDEAGEVVINDTALYERMCRFDDLLDASAYLDAAAMFVPEGWAWSAFDEVVAVVSDFNILAMHEVVATTPAFALLAAAMKARQSDERD